ncbi:DUF6402 family protein [Paraburkholderia acidicola]|uniref:DUF6402 family protein n=1 Tax=Paraburkholderia acidicola TaxID=1912599 RepID=A0ABV1LP74_9BURK
MRVTSQKLPYYSINKLLWRWSKQDGCWIVPDVALSSARSPPNLDAESAVPHALREPQLPKTKPQPGDGLLRMMQMHSRFKTWLDTPDPPRQSKPVPAPKERQETVPLFDIQEIPGAMRKNLMFKSATLMERWFAGTLNYSPTHADEEAEINQDGQPYPSNMYDTTTMKLDWVLQFARAKAQYDELIDTVVRSPASIKQLKTTLRRYRRSGADLDAWALSGQSLTKLHKHFQFEYAGVESSLGQKVARGLDTAITNQGAPDDLTGSLGSFNLYAAVAYAHFNDDATRAEVTGIYVYIKDNYTFTDKPNGVSQYLGHWGSKGVIIVPYNAAASIMNKPWMPYVDYPVAVGDVHNKGNVYYPIHNSAFRAWAKKHQRGGDFVVYSDYKFVPLYPPMKVYL